MNFCHGRRALLLLRLQHLADLRRIFRGKLPRPVLLQQRQQLLNERLELLEHRRGFAGHSPRSYPDQQRHRPAEPSPPPLTAQCARHRLEEAAELVG
jgi:hypothetical protein